MFLLEFITNTLRALISKNLYFYSQVVILVRSAMIQALPRVHFTHSNYALSSSLAWFQVKGQYGHVEIKPYPLSLSVSIRNLIPHLFTTTTITFTTLKNSPFLYLHIQILTPALATLLLFLFFFSFPIQFNSFPFDSTQQSLRICEKNSKP